MWTSVYQHVITMSLKTTSMLKLFYTDLLPSSRGDMPEVHHVPGDAQHGRERREPTEGVRPPRVLIVHVFNRLPLNEVKYEHALEVKIECLFC